MKKEKIEPNKWYWLGEIHRKKIIPAIKSYLTLKKWAESGRLKATIYGTKNGKRYMIKGKNLIEFLAKLEAGDFQWKRNLQGYDHERKGGVKI